MPAAPASREGQRGAGGSRPGGLAARRRRFAAFSLLLLVGLAGLAAAAVGIAHGVLPRQFTAAQRHQITGWEMERQWRVLSAGQIFPASVSYPVSAADLNATSGLTLQARRLAISSPESCTAAFAAAAGRVLARDGCSTVLRATYVDSSASMVATIAVAVLPAGASASSVLGDLAGTATGPAGSVLTFPVPGTPAAGFSDAQRQLSLSDGAGPYVILSTAGFSDDRGEQVSSDLYVKNEMASFVAGLVNSTKQILGKQPRTPVCPGAPGC